MKTLPPYEIAEVSSTLSTSGVVTHNPGIFPILPYLKKICMES